MKVLHVCADAGIPLDGTKGASVHLRSLAEAFTSAGHEVALALRRRPLTPDPHLASSVVGLDVLDRPLDADVVYERCSLGHTAGLDAARRSGVPFVLEVNAPLVDEAVAHRPDTVAPHHRSDEDRLLSEADLVAVVSRPLAEWVAGRGRTGPTVVVPNGCPAAALRPARVRPPSPPVLAFVGHPKPWHGVEALPEIIGGLVDLDARLVVVGAGPGADELARTFADRGLDHRLTITGPVDGPTVADHLATASLGLAPYGPIEPCYFSPLKVVEYLAAALPVVTTSQGDIPEMVGGAGALVAPGDTEAMVAAARHLLFDEAAWSAASAEAAARASSMTWDRRAAAVLAAVDALVPA